MTLKARFGDPKTEKDIVAAKRFNFFALIVLMIVCAAALIFYLELINKKRELETKSIELADSTAILQRTRSELEAAQVMLAEREEVVEDKLLKLADQVEQKDFTAAIQTANDYSKKLHQEDIERQCWINFYAWKPDPTQLPIIRTYLKRKNYMLVNDKVLKQHHKWIGTNSAIYYYSKGTKAIATDLAINLKRISGIKFEVLEGRPEDAVHTKKVDWFNIHYIGSKSIR